MIELKVIEKDPCEICPHNNVPFGCQLEIHCIKKDIHVKELSQRNADQKILNPVVEALENILVIWEIADELSWTSTVDNVNLKALRGMVTEARKALGR